MSIDSGNSCVKQPIRRLEIPINKFDVAISHHLDLLRLHKDNIKKFGKIKQWDKVHKEQVNASRLVKQLEQLLYEMDTLRGQVRNEDIEKFDKLTLQSRSSTINAIQEYLEMELETPPSVIEKNYTSDDQQGEQNDPLNNDQNQLLQRVDQENEQLERQKACFSAWNLLQNDLHQLHQLFVDFNQMIKDQKEQVDRIEDEVIVSDKNVTEGNKNVERALKFKATAYPIAGALIGTCIGGPVGLVAGFKFGGLAALGCGVLGFAGATILKKKQLEKMKSTDQIELDTPKNTDSVRLSREEEKKEL